MPRPAAAKRIRAAREQAGLIHERVAAQVGLNLASYYDLEAYDDEAFNVISLRQLQKLASALGVPALALLGDAPELTVTPTFSTAELVARLRGSFPGDQLGAFSDRAGWDVASVLADPERIWDDWCVDALRDVCAAVGLDWQRAQL